MARKTLTEEEKAARAAARAEKAAETKKDRTSAAPDKDAEIAALKAELARMHEALEKQKTAESETELLKKQVKELMERQAPAPQVITVAADAPKVQFVWMAPVADDNITMFGDGGMYAKITGKTGTFTVPKTELSRVMTSMVQYFLEERWLIITSGLTDEEREAMGVDYKPGELLDRRAFMRLVDMEDAILPLYPDLCQGHREMVVKAYHEAFADGNPHVRRDVVVELNRMSKAAGNRDGAYRDIIERMNAADV